MKVLSWRRKGQKPTSAAPYYFNYSSTCWIVAAILLVISTAVHDILVVVHCFQPPSPTSSLSWSLTGRHVVGWNPRSPARFPATSPPRFPVHSSAPSHNSRLWSFYYDPNQGTNNNDDDNDDANGNDDMIMEDADNIGAAFAQSETTSPQSLNSSSSSSSASPTPSLSAVDVATLCMDALQNEILPQTSLSVCFEFSSDRCRAAVGGTLDEFVKYASNPVFGALVHCHGYRILSVGPIIPGSQHRGEMQTVLIEINKAMTVGDAVGEYNTAQQQQQQHSSSSSSPSTQSSSSELPRSSQRPSGRPTIEERKRAREERKKRIQQQQKESASDSSSNDTTTSTQSNNISGGNDVIDDTKVFLWTMQKERRPPRQNCWLVHEVLHKRNAFLQTT